MSTSSFANGVIIEQKSLLLDPQPARRKCPPALVLQEAYGAQKSEESGSRRLLAEETTAVRNGDAAASLAAAEDELYQSACETRYSFEVQQDEKARLAGASIATAVQQREVVESRREVEDLQAVSKRQLQMQKELSRAQRALGEEARRAERAEMRERRETLDEVAVQHGADTSDFFCVKSLQDCLSRLADCWTGGENDAVEKQLLTGKAQPTGLEPSERSLVSDGPLASESCEYADEELRGELSRYRKEMQSRERSRRAAQKRREEERDAEATSSDTKKERREEAWMTLPAQLPGIGEALSALDPDELLLLKQAFDEHGHEAGTMSMALLLRVFARLGLGNQTAQRHARQLRSMLPSRQHEYFQARIAQKGMRVPFADLEEVKPEEEHFINLGEAAIILAKMRFCVYDRVDKIGLETCD